MHQEYIMLLLIVIMSVVGFAITSRIDRKRRRLLIDIFQKVNVGDKFVRTYRSTTFPSAEVKDLVTIVEKSMISGVPYVAYQYDGEDGLPYDVRFECFIDAFCKVEEV